ncbi:uncharacterized protein GLRG_05899 [Colletotrichum graminicola M1.001]|uniref:Uncharacterized protein n=1 Tax=Colletotrichum graminicola (strain M1.001 / M2 / FGSC 10212) TaxID=645133 RepID=E3QIR7_COLGM|nr:uncharacterized protein GLRG_05899 [Colletotrichum graminicola M1.001]EFQ30755.1 hypothetical protein GLRG_05899 [Colletotrichum graminicola M1.001]
MTAADRLECPLLLCRKRFPSHEAMLRHLYSCDQLSTGEYWCYECGKAEKFTDGKCKRCLGHPGKRRRIMSVAKNFFSSLGQKSKNQGMLDLDMKNASDIAIFPPPSYDSCIQPQQVELSSCSEILEIDSIEVPLPTPTNIDRGIMEAESAMSMAMEPTALESAVSVMPDLSFDWLLQTNVGANDNSISGKPDRPSLSLYTYGLEQRRKQHQPTTRTKNLSPSNSLRSNASTDTTASYLVSPASAFSGTWTTAETGITSPASDSSSGGLLSRGCSNASRYSNYSIQPHAFISELPADDIMLQPLPLTLSEDLDCDQQLSLLDTSILKPRRSETRTCGPGKTFDAPATMVRATDMAMPAFAVDANSLVGSAWDTLKTHITSSLEKLQHLSRNPLVEQLQGLSSQDVANKGIATLKVLLEGIRPTSSIDMLCFVHITYSLSLIVHEDDARNRSRQLFAQAFRCSDWLVGCEREQYTEVALAIWQPLDFSPSEMNVVLSERHQDAISSPSSLKGKERATSWPRKPLEKNVLLEVACFFLDELERTALPSKDLESSEVLGSMLWTKHSTHATDSLVLKESLDATCRALRSEVHRGFAHAKGLNSKIKRIQKRIGSSSVRSARRVELELLQAGKGCVTLQEYFDSYVPMVRELLDDVYNQHVPRGLSRTRYHVHGTDLMQTIISRICEKEAIKHTTQDTTNVTSEAALDEFIRSTTTALDDSWESFLTVQEDPLAMPTPLTGAQMMMMDDTTLADTVTTFCEAGELPTRPTFPMPPTRSKVDVESFDEMARASPSGAGQKFELKTSDSCEICGYQPKGDPQWFKGSMAKHKKLQHSTAPPKIYRCPYPGCTSQYKNRPDNLKQHQQDKGHFVDGETGRRPSKRKKREE